MRCCAASWPLWRRWWRPTSRRWRQRDSGQVSGIELAARRNALAQTRQQLPPLRKQFEQNRNLLRQLAGIAPDGELPAFARDALPLPAELPLSLPSQLVEQRPDIRLAEEQLRAATAQVGVARAARLPQFTVSGNAGGTASQLGQMFWSSGKFFDLTANLALPLFDGGTLKHRERAAVAMLDAAAADYRAAVATGFQNVADVLQAIDADHDAFDAAQEASAAAQALHKLTMRQHAAGYLDRLALIAAEQDARQAALALAQAQASRLGNAAALFQALGGGWWHRSAQPGEPPAG
ncbi:MAG: TolC family protein [Duganella sp.]